MVDLIRKGAVQPRREHARGRQCALGRLRDSRSGTRCAHAVHYDARQEPPRRFTRSRRRDMRKRSRFRSGSRRRRSVSEPAARAAARRRRRSLSARTRCSASSAAASSPGSPGQFFMLEAPGRLLPRACSLCLAPAGELAFLIDAVGPGPNRSARSLAVMRFTSSDRSATASGSMSSGRCSSAAVSGSRRCRTSRRRFASHLRCSASGSEFHAEAAALLPGSGDRDRSDARHRADSRRPPGARMRAGADAGSDRLATPGCATRLGGADGVWLRRLLRLCGGDRRRAETVVRRRAGAPCCLTPPAASMLSSRPRSRGGSTPS